MTGIIDPARFGMPDATTGVPAGATLTAYTGPMTITTPGTVIEGKIINGTLRVTAPDVTIKNCLVQNYSWWGVDAEDGANITIQNCDFIASSTMDTNAAILGSGTFIGNDISNSANGIVLTDGASVVRDNYIHDLRSISSDAHVDGISVQGGQNHVLIEHNTVEAWDTSCIFIKNDFGPINDITVRNNLLYGDQDRGDPAATIYVYGPNTTNVFITNNYVEKGNWFYYATSNATPTISGNIEWNNKTDPTPYPNSGPTPATGSVSINDVTISEGNSGTKVATFTVTRSGGTAAFDVNFATSNGTATVADSDYVATSNTLHFGANQNTQTISVTINGDTKVESSEAFNVVLSTANNGATISDSQGAGTITNDDAAAIAGSISINNITISEGNSGTKVATFAVTRSGGAAAFDVNFATSNGTATVADSDYVATSNTLHFGTNENTKTISVTINGDTELEANETFNVVLSTATNGAIISDGQGVGTITSDDIAPVADLDGNPLVNDPFYYARNKDVWDAGVDADAHYNAFGWREGRDPNAFFDTSAYLAAYSDVAAAGVNPLEHYLVFGWREGRDPSGAFDTDAYLAAYPDVAAAGVNPLEHFLVFGINEGRSAFSDGIIN